MSTADVAQAAADLSNLRLRLVLAANDAQQSMFTNNKVRAEALRRLIAAVDDVSDGLLPFAFYDDTDREVLLALSVAVSYARGGDATSAGKTLTALFAPSELGEVA